MLGLQLALFCLLYIGMVKIAVKDSGLNCLYFYPDAFLDEAEKRGIADKETTKKKGKRFMIPFCLILLAALLLAAAEGAMLPYTLPWLVLLGASLPCFAAARGTVPVLEHLIMKEELV